MITSYIGKYHTMEQHIERYTKYIHEMVHKLDIYTATYKEHLHKAFEWYGCIELSRQSGTVVLRWEDVPADMREEKNMSRDMGIDAWDMVGDFRIGLVLERIGHGLMKMGRGLGV